MAEAGELAGISENATQLAETGGTPEGNSEPGKERAPVQPPAKSQHKVSHLLAEECRISNKLVEGEKNNWTGLAAPTVIPSQWLVSEGGVVL